MSIVEPVEQADVGETVAHAWYTDDDSDDRIRHPWDGATKPRYDGPTPPFTTLEGFDSTAGSKRHGTAESRWRWPLARMPSLHRGRSEVTAAVDRS
jgi:Ni,Fe-hydrogenase I large subunit